MIKNLLLALALLVPVACAVDYVDDEVTDEELMSDEEVAAEIESLSEGDGRDFLEDTQPQACIKKAYSCYFLPNSLMCCAPYTCMSIGGNKGICY